MRNRDNYIVSFRYHAIDPYGVAFPEKTIDIEPIVQDVEQLTERNRQLNVQVGTVFKVGNFTV